MRCVFKGRATGPFSCAGCDLLEVQGVMASTFEIDTSAIMLEAG